VANYGCGTQVLAAFGRRNRTERYRVTGVSPGAVRRATGDQDRRPGAVAGRAQQARGIYPGEVRRDRSLGAGEPARRPGLTADHPWPITVVDTGWGVTRLS